MLIIPAIDLKDGQCVRLKQGLMEEATVFSDSPGEQAARWLEPFAMTWIHLAFAAGHGRPGRGPGGSIEAGTPQLTPPIVNYIVI